MRGQARSCPRYSYSATHATAIWSGTTLVRHIYFWLGIRQSARKSTDRPNPTELDIIPSTPHTMNTTASASEAPIHAIQPVTMNEGRGKAIKTAANATAAFFVRRSTARNSRDDAAMFSASRNPSNIKSCGINPGLMNSSDRLFRLGSKISNRQ